MFFLFSLFCVRVFEQALRAEADTQAGRARKLEARLKMRLGGYAKVRVPPGGPALPSSPLTAACCRCRSLTLPLLLLLLFAIGVGSYRPCGCLLSVRW